jgi:SAM-dependent methyltransferase
MKTDAENWFKEDGEKVLKDIGIKRGDIVLDFGCGEGTYSLPAAKIAGKGGKVFALDKSISKLDELTRRAKSARLENIKTVKTSGRLKVPFGYEGDTFASTENVEDDLLSITSVYPMREEAVKKFLQKEQIRPCFFAHRVYMKTKKESTD